MMEFNNKNKNRGLVKCLSMVLVLILSFTMAVQVLATELEGKEIDPAANEVVVTEPAADAQAVTPEEMAEAWAALLAVMNEEQIAFYNATITAAQGSDALLRADVKAALEACTACLKQEAALYDQRLQTETNIANSAELTQEQKDLFLAQIQELMESVNAQLQNLAQTPEGIATPLEILMQDLTALMADQPALDKSGELASYAAAVEAFIDQLSGLDALLESLSKVPAMQAELEELKVQFSQAGAKAGPTEVALIQQLQNLSDRCTEVGSKVNAYFTLSAEDRDALQQQIADVEGEVEAFTTSALVAAIRHSDALEALVNDNEAESEQMKSLQVLLYVALGVAALGLILAIVATILAAAKAKEKEVDLSVFATREDAEHLSQQNKILKQQRDQQEQAMEQLRRDLDRLNREVKEVAAQPKAEPKPQPKAESKPEPKPEPKPVSLGSSEEVCRLNMVYRAFTPRQSYLEVSPDGDYILYADNTVELSKSAVAMSNTFKGWTSNGLLLLFETEVNGKALDAERDIMPTGYYSVTETKRRAVVGKIEENRYALQFRGYVRMSNE